MARPLRIQYPGAYYHVTCRGNARKEVFLDDFDRKVFLEKLSESLETYNVALLVYVCMTNHFHLLVSTPGGNLSELMRHFNICYTSAFNRRHNQVGHLYQGRYYVGGDNATGRQAYLEFIKRGLDREIESPLRLGKGSSIVGGSDFVDLIKHEILETKTSGREQPALKALQKTIVPEKLINRFAFQVGMAEEEICTRGKSSIERAMLMEFLYRFCRIAQPEIGRLVGGIDYSAVSQARRRLKMRLSQDRKLSRRFEELKRVLTGES